MKKPIEWRAEMRKLSTLKRWVGNPRVIKETPLADLKRSIGKFGLAEPLVIQPDGELIGGHARFEILLADKVGKALCMVPSRQLTPKERDELGVRLNKNVAGEWDWDALANSFEIEDVCDWGFTMKELGLTDDGEKVSFTAKKKECPSCGFEF